MPKKSDDKRNNNNTNAPPRFDQSEQYNFHCARMHAAHERACAHGVGALFGELFRFSDDDGGETVMFHTAQRAFRLVDHQRGTSRLLPGITRHLRKLFWPTYDYMTVLQRQKGRRQQRCRRDDDDDRGQRLGSRVHRELQRYIDSDGRRPASSSLSSYTRDLINAFETQWGWVPLLGEAPVYLEEAGLASAIDAIVYSRHNKRLVLIELKTGYDQMMHQSTGRMHSLALEHLRNSPYEQAVVQLGIAAHALATRAGVDINRFDCYVVQVNADAVIPHRCDPTFLRERIPLAYEHLIDATRKRRPPRKKRAPSSQQQRATKQQHHRRRRH